MSGVIADRFGTRDVELVHVRADHRDRLHRSAVCAPVFFSDPNTTVALCAAIVPALMGATYLGPSYAMAQGMVPLRMRAQTVGILLFVLNMIALGLGPPRRSAISACCSSRPSATIRCAMRCWPAL